MASSNGKSAVRVDSTAVTTAALAFRVVHDHMTSVFRCKDLASALAATDPTEVDFVN
nr:hypothetical protein [Mycobacterium uberis]